MSNLIFAVPSKGRLMEATIETLAAGGMEVRKTGNERGCRGEIAGMKNVEIAFISASEIANALRRRGDAEHDPARVMFVAEDAHDPQLAGLGVPRVADQRVRQGLSADALASRCQRCAAVSAKAKTVSNSGRRSCSGRCMP